MTAEQTSNDLTALCAFIADRGFALVPAVFSVKETSSLAAELQANLEQSRGASRSRNGNVYAARNLLELMPSLAECARQAPLTELLKRILGPDCGLVRGLFFDKPPSQSWSLPWHRDLTLAVVDNRLQTSLFKNPTTKAGVPHMEAPDCLLQSMLTLRIHLDAAFCGNGALRVIPGSHHCRTEVLPDDEGRLVTAAAGDVLAMRPLLSHCSGVGDSDNVEHRRIIHLEYASSPNLPDDFQWYHFIPLDP